MDPFWNNFMLNEVDTPTDANMPYIDLTSDESGDMNNWISDAPSSSTHPQAHTSHEEFKMENNWASSLTINGNQGSNVDRGQGPRIEGNRLESAHLNLSNHQPVTDQSFNENFNAMPIPIISGSMGLVHVPSSSNSLNLSVSSSRKRKNAEEIYAQSSTSGSSSHINANTTLNIPSQANYQSAPKTRPGSTLSVGPCDAAKYVQNSQRNCRVRINPPQNAAPTSVHWAPANSIVSPNLLIPFNQPMESHTSNSHQPNIPSVPSLVQNMRPFPVNLASSSRTSGSSSRSQPIITQRSSATRNTNSNLSLTPLLHVGTSTSTSARVVQNRPRQYQRIIQEASHRPMIPIVHSGSIQSQSVNNNITTLNTGSSTTANNTLDRRIAILRSLQQEIARDPSAVRAARDSRSRVLMEIRNALARRGEQLNLQGMLSFDQAVFHGRAADMHDRHRDMRLDVDNMSYEELLALEERIGNVNIGLSEEKISKSLRQRKYISLTEQTPGEMEPCCICREEYVAEEDVGRLDCGHDFHSKCITQWLMQKNLCPICKTTGLAA